MKKSMAISLCLVGAVCISAFDNVWSQSYPDKPIHMLSSFGPGSVAEGVMRMVGKKMGESMGQPIVIEMLNGAGGVLAAQRVAHSAPDGYTILQAPPASLVSTPFLVTPPPYHPLKDFTYITHLADTTTCLLVTAALPVRTVQELIAYAKANPGLAYGSNGIGGAFHLEMELLKQRYGFDVTHVPYRGGEQALLAAATGQIPIAYAPAGAAIVQERAGKVRILAVLSVKRFPSMPDIPSMGEQLPGYEKMPGGVEVVGPAGMPASIVRRLNAEIVKALYSPEVLDRLLRIGFVPVGNTPEEHAAQMRRAMETMAKGTKAARIVVE